MATPGVDPSILQTALLQVAEATKAASEAAKAASVAQQKATTSSGGATSVDWSKLFNRPPVFEHATTEAEIKGFRDWSWQVCQYLATIDANYDEEVKKLFDDPPKVLTCQAPQWRRGHVAQNFMGCWLHLCVESLWLTQSRALATQMVMKLYVR